jgi:hypothetical protein
MQEPIRGQPKDNTERIGMGEIWGSKPERRHIASEKRHKAQQRA